jgi:pilus assembly protein Flp/PilA
MNQKGQGLIEYLIIVALMAVATIGIVRVLGQTVSAKFATATYALQGTRKTVRVESVDDSLHKKKDLGNFMNGVGDGGNE